MGPRVGARLEVVQTRPISDRSDWGYLAILVLISLAIHGWMLSRSTMTAKDAIGFARVGFSLFHPREGGYPERTTVDILKEKTNHHPPAFPIVVALSTSVVHRMTALHPADEMLRGAQFASAFSALLLIIPTYGLGRLLFSRTIGFWFALFLQILPVFARVATDGLNDILHLALVSFSLLFAARGLRRPRVGQYLLAGFFAGAAYLVRPEGLSVVVLLGGLTALKMVTKQWQTKLSIALFFALGIGAAIPAAPYMLIIGGFTNKPSGNPDVDASGNPRVKMIRGTAHVHGGPLFAEKFSEATGTEKIGRTLLAVVRETGKTTHYALGVLGILGIFLLRNELRQRYDYLLLILYGGLHCLLLIYLGMTKAYISERHTLPLAMILSLFGVVAVQRLLTQATDGFSLGSRIVALILALACIPGLIKPPHQSHMGHLELGRLLRGEQDPDIKIDDNDQIFDPYEWSAFMCGRTRYFGFTDPPPSPGRYCWIVWVEGDTYEKDHTKDQTRFVDAERNKQQPGTQLVAQWPPKPANTTEPPAKGSILLFRRPFTEAEIAQAKKPAPAP